MSAKDYVRFDEVVAIKALRSDLTKETGSGKQAMAVLGRLSGGAFRKRDTAATCTNWPLSGAASVQGPL